MAFSYTLPILSDRDRVRLLLRDTDATVPLYQDEELDELLAERGDPLQTAIAAAEGAALGFARRPDVSIGDQKISYVQVARAMADTAAALRAQLNTTYAGVLYGGGIDPSELAQDILDPTLVRPWFTRWTGDDRGGTYPSAATPAGIAETGFLVSGDPTVQTP